MNTLKSSIEMLIMSLYIIGLFATFAFSSATLSEETKKKKYIKFFSSIVFSILFVNTFKRWSTNPKYNFNKSKITALQSLISGLVLAIFLGSFAFDTNYTENSSLNTYQKTVLSKLSIVIFTFVAIWQVLEPMTKLLFKTENHGSYGISLVYMFAIATLIWFKVDKSLITDKSSFLQEAGLLTGIFVLCLMTYITIKDKSNSVNYFAI